MLTPFKPASVVASYVLLLPSLWTFSYFFLIYYMLFIFSVSLYLLTNSTTFVNFTSGSNPVQFLFATGFDYTPMLITPVVLWFSINHSWHGAAVLTWFGHLICMSFQIHIFYAVMLVFLLVWVSYLGVFYYTSQELSDYTLAANAFVVWVGFLFFSNNFLTFIFFIEILSTLIMLLVITSTFSSTYFYSNRVVYRHAYFSQTAPTSFLQMIIFFFWISLIASLMLFIFLTLTYLFFFTFDWYLIESVLLYLVGVSNFKTTGTLTILWFTLMFCVFLKCGLVPFFFWKPVFFKGMPLHILFFYVVFFYFFIFLFFTYFLVLYFNELFYYGVIVNLLLLSFGVIVLLFILCESFYIKAFLAMSSILNTLFVFLSLNSLVVVDSLFCIY